MTLFRTPIKDILSLSYYRYEITPSSENPNIDTAFTVTVKCTNVRGNPIPNKELTLYYDNTTQGTETTDTFGEATWTITPTTWGLRTIKVGNTTKQVNVDGIRWDTNTTNYKIGRTQTKGILMLNGWTNPTSTSLTGNYNTFSSTTTANSFRPTSNKNGIVSSTDGDVMTFRVRSDNGVLEYKGISSVANGKTWYAQIEWTINDSQR